MIARPGPAGSILIVDDEEGLQTTPVTSFSKEGYRTAGAT